MENLQVGRPRKVKPTRAQKAEQTRLALFEAAATVVGTDGYEEASVAKIVALAGVANGTFYNYFESRQDLFDQLLPAVGDQLIDFIRSLMVEVMSGHERERMRLHAYFLFFEKNPGFLRVLNEAEVFAPAAYQEHIQRFAIRYMKALQKQRDDGELVGYSDSQLEAIVFMLMGARTYMTLLLKQSGKHRSADLVDCYMSLIAPGLYKKPL